MVLERALFGWTAWVVMEMNQMLRSVYMMAGVSPTAHMMRMLESSAKIILLVRRSYHIREYLYKNDTLLIVTFIKNVLILLLKWCFGIFASSVKKKNSGYNELSLKRIV